MRIEISWKKVSIIVGTSLGVGMLVGVIFFSVSLFMGVRGADLQLLAERQTSSPAPSIAPSQTDPTAGWKVYDDNKTGFSIEYPSNWLVQNSTRDQPNWVMFASPDLQEQDTGAVMTGQKVTIYIESKGSHTPYSGPIGDSDASELISEDSIRIDGIPATQRTFARMLGEAGKVVITEILWKEKVYTVICHPTKDSKINVHAICDLMLQTLRQQVRPQ